jgi:hypothetical protein
MQLPDFMTLDIAASTATTIVKAIIAKVAQVNQQHLVPERS